MRLAVALAALLLAPALAWATVDEIHFHHIASDTVAFQWRGDAGDTTIFFNTSLATLISNPDQHLQTASLSNSPSPTYPTDKTFYAAKLRPLTANTRYYYAIGKVDTVNHRSFVTASANNAASQLSWTAAGDQGDSTVGNYGASVDSINKLIKKLSPNQHLMLGDLTYANNHGREAINPHFNNIQNTWGREVAYMPTWGNHDSGEAGDFTGTGTCGTDSTAAYWCAHSGLADKDTILDSCFKQLPRGPKCKDDPANYKGRWRWLPNTWNPAIHYGGQDTVPHSGTAGGSHADSMAKYFGSFGCDTCYYLRNRPVVPRNNKDWYWWDNAGVRFISIPWKFGSATKPEAKHWEYWVAPVVFEADTSRVHDAVVFFSHVPLIGPDAEGEYKTVVDSMAIGLPGWSSNSKWQNKIVMHLAGHSHTYYRCNPSNNYTEIVAGTAGASLSGDAGSADTARAFRYRGVVRVTMPERGLFKGQFIAGPALLATDEDVAGQPSFNPDSTIDTWTICRQPAPEPISDLAVDSRTGTQLHVAWTEASSDSSTYGPARFMQFKRRTLAQGPITDENWDSSTWVVDSAYPPVPGQAGGAAITGLSSNSAYYVAMKERSTLNGTCTWSTVSNNACGWTEPHEDLECAFDRPGESIGQAKALRFWMGEPRPNPTTGTTGIDFEVANRTDLKVAVYDIAGRQIMVLARGEYLPGAYSVAWTGHDARGNRVRAGLYLIRYQAAGVKFVRRLVLQ